MGRKINLRTYFYFLLALLLCTNTLSSQDSGEEELGAWYMFFGTNKVAERWSVHTEAQWRFFETNTNFNQLLLRTGINYHISSEAIATLGYGFIETDGSFLENPGSFDLLEHRIFEQFILKNKVWEFGFEHRFRFEQRFINTRNLDNPNEVQHRARYRLQLTLPLTDTFFLNFYDEVFLNLQGNTFGQNRLYGALGIHVTSNTSVQLGYLSNNFGSQTFDRLQFAVFYNPDLRKLKKSKS